MVARSKTYVIKSSASLSSFKYNFTEAFNMDNWTFLGSSLKFSAKSVIKVTELSIKSPYYPTIQTMAAFASALSNAFKLSHKSLMILSYRLGYFLKISLMTMTASWTT